MNYLVWENNMNKCFDFIKSNKVKVETDIEKPYSNYIKASFDGKKKLRLL